MTAWAGDSPTMTYRRFRRTKDNGKKVGLPNIRSPTFFCFTCLEERSRRAFWHTGVTCDCHNVTVDTVLHVWKTGGTVVAKYYGERREQISNE